MCANAVRAEVEVTKVQCATVYTLEYMEYSEYSVYTVRERLEGGRAYQAAINHFDLSVMEGSGEVALAGAWAARGEGNCKSSTQQMFDIERLYSRSVQCA
eukprot:4535151-Alexandrium_andersonii.AAC.1